MPQRTSPSPLGVGLVSREDIVGRQLRPAPFVLRGAGAGRPPPVARPALRAPSVSMACATASPVRRAISRPPRVCQSARFVQLAGSARATEAPAAAPSAPPGFGASQRRFAARPASAESTWMRTRRALSALPGHQASRGQPAAPLVHLAREVMLEPWFVSRVLLAASSPSRTKPVRTALAELSAASAPHPAMFVPLGTAACRFLKAASPARLGASSWTSRRPAPPVQPGR